MKKYILILFSFITVFAQNYKVPPSTSTLRSAPIISDEMMEKCIKVYNEDILWLESKASYDKSANDRYNNAVSWFNKNCANKQSYSACKKANELNRQKGLAEQNCSY